ncbi:MAG: hypothetical protein QOJ63_3041 [Solirubrobacteraceae bacterium]|jgi:hypothetical protein|nr:hypothetical protein [Solirubrobacteraceae bacterium]
MIDRKSRYRSTPVLTVSDERGGAQPLLDLRETPPASGLLQVTPTDSDRLDLLASRFYRDPTRFWRICDASSELDPFDVVAAGEQISIPPDR